MFRWMADYYVDYQDSSAEEHFRNRGMVKKCINATLVTIHVCVITGATVFAINGIPWSTFLEKKFNDFFGTYTGGNHQRTGTSCVILFVIFVILGE